ncbi:MAG: DUF4172 domain-containing protein [Bacteroidia bacterium]
MLKAYNWQQEDWLQFKYSNELSEEVLQLFLTNTGYLKGFQEGLSEEEQLDSLLKIMMKEALKTSSIEGEVLSKKDVLSSIKKKLGLLQSNEKLKDKKAEGIAELMVDVRKTFKSPLNEEMLFRWHKKLMKGDVNVLVGQYRTHPEPMQVVSGAMGKLRVHFEAPPSIALPVEMSTFISWFNETEHELMNPVLRAALAHLYFESLHPFEDGNGRIGRALAEKALSQGLGSPVLFSLSAAIEADKKAYYSSLQKAQSSNEVNSWLKYFNKLVLKAQELAKDEMKFTAKKSQFFKTYGALLNERQLKAVNRMFEEGPEGFIGGMNTAKYMGITKASKATATRDLQEARDAGYFVSKGGGRSTSYELNL